jgi:hypothetical protein
VSRGPNLIDIVAVGHDGSLIHTWWDGSDWSVWESRIAGPQITFVTQPAVVASGADRFDLVVLGSDGILYHFWWTQGAFRGPNKLQSPVGPKPTLIRTPSGKLYAFGCDSYNNLIGASFDGSTWTAPGELGTGFGPMIEGRVHYPSLYRFSMDNVKAATSRSAFQDTDVGSVSVTPGNWPTTTATEIFQTDILDGSNYQPQFLVLDRVPVELCEYVIFNYHIDNKANAREIDPVDAKVSMEAVATAAAEYALKSLGKQLTAGVMAITTIEVASLGVPVIGPLLGILAGWLIGELGDFLKSGHCDGPVALEQPTLTGVELYSDTMSGAHTTATTHPGKPSPAGCGGTSKYIVTWSIMRDR